MFITDHSDNKDQALNSDKNVYNIIVHITQYNIL
jgi:hypothetical protein